MTAVAAGTFNQRELEEARVRHWASFADEHHSRKQGLFPWEARLYKQFLKPGARLLVVGAGSGRDVLCFLREGCVVTAIDESADALRSLERRLAQAELSARVEPASIADFESDERFDLVIFSWLAYTLIPTKPARLSALRRSAQVLAPGGAILVSYKPGKGSPRLGQLARAVAGLVGGARSEDFEEFNFSGPASLPRVYHSRFYTAEEIEEEAADAGLSVLDHHRGSPGWDDPGWVVLGNRDVRSGQ